MINLDRIRSESILLSDEKNGLPIVRHQADRLLPPASLTKLMTALVACDLFDCSFKATITQDILDPLRSLDASMAGFACGESASFKQLIYGLLMASGAECAMAFCSHTPGKTKAFVEKMNDKAAQLHMTSTVYCSPTGLDEDSVTTAEDTLLLLREVLKNPLLKAALSCPFAFLLPAKKRPFGRRLRHTLCIRCQKPRWGKVHIIGGKTGFTDFAGQCLASWTMIHGRLFACVSLQAPGHYGTERMHVQDALELYGQVEALLSLSPKKGLFPV